MNPTLGKTPALGKVAGIWTQHRPVVLASAAGLALVLGYRHHKNAAAAASTAPNAVDPTTGAAIAGYAPAGATGAAGYDSTGTDVYNALQPQVEQTQNLLQTLLDRIGAPVRTITVTRTVPGKKPAARPKRKKKAKKKAKHHKHGGPRRPAPQKHPTAPPRRRLAAPAARVAAPPPRQVARPAPRRAPTQPALPRRKA